MVISPSKSSDLLSAHPSSLTTTVLLKSLEAIGANRGILVVHGLKDPEWKDYSLDLMPNVEARVDFGLLYPGGAE